MEILGKDGEKWVRTWDYPEAAFDEIRRPLEEKLDLFTSYCRSCRDPKMKLLTEETKRREREHRKEDKEWEAKYSPVSPRPRKRKLPVSTLRKVLEALTPLENKAVAMYYGVDTNGRRSIEEISRSLKLSRDRVRKVLRVARHKLKHPLLAPKWKALKDQSATKKISKETFPGPPIVC